MSLNIFDSILDPVSQCFTAETAKALAELKYDQSHQTHVDELARKANDGELSDAERREYETIIELNDIVGILKAKARRRLREMAA